MRFRFECLKLNVDPVWLCCGDDVVRFVCLCVVGATKTWVNVAIVLFASFWWITLTSVKTEGMCNNSFSVYKGKFTNVIKPKKGEKFLERSNESRVCTHFSKKFQENLYSPGRKLFPCWEVIFLIACFSCSLLKVWLCFWVFERPHELSLLLSAQNIGWKLWGYLKKNLLVKVRYTSLSCVCMNKVRRGRNFVFGHNSTGFYIIFINLISRSKAQFILHLNNIWTQHIFAFFLLITSSLESSTLLLSGCHSVHMMWIKKILYFLSYSLCLIKKISLVFRCLRNENKRTKWSRIRKLKFAFVFSQR